MKTLVVSLALSLFALNAFAYDSCDDIAIKAAKQHYLSNTRAFVFLRADAVIFDDVNLELLYEDSRMVAYEVSMRPIINDEYTETVLPKVRYYVQGQGSTVRCRINALKPINKK